MVFLKSEKSDLTTRQKGRLAETYAEQYLTKNGLTLVAKNFSCKQGEVDLIMQDKDIMVFVEVRHRLRSDYGTPAETVTREKQRKIIKTSILFMMKYHWYGKKDVRFDVLALEGTLNESPKVTWIKRAFSLDF